MRALLVHHEDAGSGEHGRGELLAALAAERVAAVPCAVDASAIRAAFAAKKFDLAVVAGGDGTTALVIATAAELLAAGEPVPPIAPLPIGGLNNIACSFGIEGEVRAIAAGWREGRYARLDVGSAGGAWGQRCFVEAAGFGALSDALSGITVSPDKPSEKMAIGRTAFRKALAQAEPGDAVLWLDGERLAQPLLMLEVLNLPRIGPRLRLAPEADPADGQFDVLMISPDDRASMLAWLEDDSTARCPVPARRAKEIRVEGGFTRCRLDDPKREQDTGGAAVTLRTMPQAVTILLSGPASAMGEAR